MSNSLVRKSLELFGYEQELKQDKKKKRRIKYKYKGALELIPPKHRVFSKHDKIDLGAVLGRTSKTSVYEAKKKLEEQDDPTEENVQRLLLLSSNRIDPDTADKLLERAVKKRYIPKEQKKSVPQSTAFTEEDFKKFEAEYVE